MHIYWKTNILRLKQNKHRANIAHPQYKNKTNFQPILCMHLNDSLRQFVVFFLFFFSFFSFCLSTKWLVNVCLELWNVCEKLCIPKTSHIQCNQSTAAIWFVDEIRDWKKKTEFEKNNHWKKPNRMQRAQARNTHRYTAWNQKRTLKRIKC